MGIEEFLNQFCPKDATGYPDAVQDLHRLIAKLNRQSADLQAAKETLEYVHNRAAVLNSAEPVENVLSVIAIGVQVSLTTIFNAPPPDIAPAPVYQEWDGVLEVAQFKLYYESVSSVEIRIPHIVQVHGEHGDFYKVSWSGGVNIVAVPKKFISRLA